MKSFVFLIFVAVSSAETDFLQANNNFSASLYKEIAKKENSNFLTSPFSAEAVLALTLSGAKGQTAEELQQVTKLSELNTEKIPNLEDEDYTLKTANKIYVQNDFAINEKFAKLAPAEAIDFKKNTEATATINSWVEEQTANKIKDLISSDTLTNETKVVLVNTVYFKADWLWNFPKQATRKIDFYKSENDVVKVDALHSRSEHFLYFNCPHLNAKLLEMPFKGHNASMTFILPNDKHGLAKLESQVDRALEPHKVVYTCTNVVLPKFKIETKIDLKEVLQNLGVQAIFKESQADLSGISGEKGELVVSDVLQKTFLDLNEEGVEAAAATFADVVLTKSGFVGDVEDFVADHPFLFYIRIKGVIVFVGRVSDPSVMFS